MKISSMALDQVFFCCPFAAVFSVERELHESRVF